MFEATLGHCSRRTGWNGNNSKDCQMIGPIVDSASLALGGVAGVFFGRWLPVRIKDSLPLIFGVITVSIGASLVGKAVYLPMVVMALILGTFLGELLHMEKGLEIVIRKAMSWSRRKKNTVEDGFIIQYITLVSAFCFGSMGLFGAFSEGITGNPEILFTKAVLDLFSGLIFGAVLGGRVCFIALPQFCILAALYWSAEIFMPHISEAMLHDFTACGGVIFLATGLRMCGIKIFPVINMLPALVLVFFCSRVWAVFFG